MDNERFDGWVRGLTTTRSRREAVVGLLGGGLGLLSLTESEAKHHKKKKKRGGGSPPVSPPGSPPASPPGSPPTGCTPQCQDRECGDDGCGGSCGSCGAVPCREGVCNCESQNEHTDCGGGRQCSDVFCATPPRCRNDGCFSNDACCSGVCDFGGFIPRCA